MAIFSSQSLAARIVRGAIYARSQRANIYYWPHSGEIPTWIVESKVCHEKKLITMRQKFSALPPYHLNRAVTPSLNFFFFFNSDHFLYYNSFSLLFSTMRRLSQCIIYYKQTKRHAHCKVPILLCKARPIKLSSRMHRPETGLGARHIKFCSTAAVLCQDNTTEKYTTPSEGRKLHFRFGNNIKCNPSAN